MKRSDLWITSKLWATFHAPEHVEAAIKRSLADYGLEYLDLYLVHFPLPLSYVDPEERYPPGWSIATDKWETHTADVPLASTWKAMEALVDSRLARNIGLCNVQGSLLMDLLRSARIQPAMLQIEHHPYLVQSRLLELCADKGIAVTAYSSFGPLSYRDIQSPKALGTPLLMENDVVVGVAKVHEKSTAQILLRWAVQRYVCVQHSELHFFSTFCSP